MDLIKTIKNKTSERVKNNNVIEKENQEILVQKTGKKTSLNFVKLPLEKQNEFDTSSDIKTDMFDICI